MELRQIFILPEKKTNGRKLNKMNEIQMVYDWLINHFSSSDLVNTTFYFTNVNGSKQENIYPLLI
jgi:hypothetical protein